MEIEQWVKDLFKKAEEKKSIEACWGLFTVLSDEYRYDEVTNIYEHMLPTIPPGTLHNYISENLESRKDFLKYKDQFVESYELYKKEKKDTLDDLAQDLYNNKDLTKGEIEFLFREWSQYFEDNYDDPHYSDHILNTLDRFHPGWDKGHPILPYEDDEV